MSREFNRLRQRVDDLEETLMQIRGGLAVVDEEQLLDAIADTGQGRQLRQVLTNISKLAG
jgi:hypothetical protein